jgi:hypothetical protein
MKALVDRMHARSQEFENHAFFHRLSSTPVRAVMPVIAANLTFWIMAFQDLLPLIEERVESSRLREIARHHRLEDQGHNRWFFQDLARLDVRPVTDVFAIFDEAAACGRRTTYALMSEIWRIDDDLLRIALLMSLESSGHVFFGRMCDYVAANGLGERLKYFGSHHIRVEKAHTVFHDQVESWLLEEPLTAAQEAAGLAMVDRTHAVFHDLFDTMVTQLSS